MSLSRLPLSYCTNVHPGRTVSEVNQGLDEFTVHVQRQFGEPLAAGLWLANSVVQELGQSADELSRFRDQLEQRGLICYTLNAFPFGDFHSTRVKENVYLPDWSTSERLEYTFRCVQTLSQLLPPDLEGSLSSMPLGFKQFEHESDFEASCIENLIELARRMHQLHAETGRTIRLAIEPEPLCLLETTQEAIEFFGRLRERAAEQNLLEAVTQHLGVCFDVCHQSVEFEDVAQSIASLESADVRINKVHITCALQIERPRENAEARDALAQYVEPRYLHQTIAQTKSQEILRAVDLSRQLATKPPADFLDAEMWRVHFHVPVDAEQLGPLETTRADLRRALAAVGKLNYSPHLEVETYTWEVLPDGQQTNLVDGLTRELLGTRELLNQLEAKSEQA